LGFNNDGAEGVARRLAAREQATGRRRTASTSDGSASSGVNKRRVGAVVGVNIGKSKVVPDDDQAAVLADYGLSAGLLAPYADYLVVNVSSPNTPGLRSLQAVERLEPLLAHVRRTADEATLGTGGTGRRVPLLVKIAPDLSDHDVLAVADLALASGLDGIIATNTTISRAHLRTDRGTVDATGAGGLSGAPLAARSLAVLRLLRDRVGPDLCLVGVGGLTTPADARARLDAGATLLQGYTAFVYEGPFWPTRVLRGLAA
jgi:dihydroorotate dehydrogenase